MCYKKIMKFLLLLPLLFLASCATQNVIVNNVDEREANEIIVYLASKNIASGKLAAPQAGGETGPSNMWNIQVPQDKAVEAMALLNQVGFPRRQGTNLLKLFAKSGLMSSEREETIRFQAGLAEQLKNTIRKIDGVLDADVEISFPETPMVPGSPVAKMTAAVYVKHQGIMEDPNNHLESKIKRLMAGSVSGLEYDNVAVISDRSRFSEIALNSKGEIVTPQERGKEYVSIWSIVMTKSSLAKFRTIFFLLLFLLILFAGVIIWMLYKFYPEFAQKTLKTFRLKQ